MNVVTVQCNECGAPLEVPASTRFLTCAHCGSSLRLQRSGGAAFTEVLESLERVGAQTEEIRGDVETIKLQNELERLDREWEREERTLLPRDKHGRPIPISRSGSGAGAVGAVVVIAGGIIWTGMTLAMGAPGFFPAFGVVFCAAAALAMIGNSKRAARYRRRLADYEARRRELTRRLDAAR